MCITQDMESQLLLYFKSLVDDIGRDVINNAAQLCVEAADRGEWREATSLWLATISEAMERAGCVTTWNVLKHSTDCADRRKRSVRKEGKCRCTFPNRVFTGGLNNRFH